jgi:hypothetical protein
MNNELQRSAAEVTNYLSLIETKLPTTKANQLNQMEYQYN